jgi:hypothetical protein
MGFVSTVMHGGYPSILHNIQFISFITFYYIVVNPHTKGGGSTRRVFLDVRNRCSHSATPDVELSPPL